jgi:hypothetical protein
MNDLLWRVEVEMPDWRRWHPLALRRLRRLLASDEEVLGLPRSWPGHLLAGPNHATVTV